MPVSPCGDPTPDLLIRGWWLCGVCSWVECQQTIDRAPCGSCVLVLLLGGGWWCVWVGVW